MRLLSAVVLVVVTQPAIAQSVYKCQGSDGRIAYQNTPCAGTTSGTAVPGHRLTGNSIIAPSEVKARDDPTTPSVRIEQPQASNARCFDDSDLRDVEVRAKSPAISPEDRQFLHNELRRIQACQLSRFSSSERKSRGEALRSLARIEKNVREGAKSTIRGLYARHQTDVEKLAEIEANRAHDKARLRDGSSPSTGMISDQFGNQYIDQGGTAFNPVTGKTCVKAGNVLVSCN